MEFIDLIKARDAALEHDAACATAELETGTAHGLAVSAHLDSKQAVLDAHKAIHDLLVERGEHYLVDQVGTLTVYKPIDDPNPPGYLAVQPIPGSGPTESPVK